MAGLKGWLSTNSKPGEPSFLDLTGGRYALPADLEKLFHKKMVTRMKAGEVFHLTEQRTPTFRMFADLDWRSNEPVTAKDQEDMASFIAQQVLLVWTLPADIKTIVCRREQVKEADGKWKGGLHLHWPDILTGPEAALVFRDAVVERCREHFGECNIGSGWGAVIDDHVYRGSGLRMVFNQKKSSADVYVPGWNISVHVEDEGGLQRPVTSTEPIKSEGPDAHWLDACSIRYHGLNRTEVQSCLQPSAGSYAGRVKEESIRAHAPGLAELKAVLPPFYKDCKFLKVLRGGSGRYFIRTDSRVCQNLIGGPTSPGAHRSNTIYFVVTATETYQACFCGCETADGRVTGPCKNYRSVPIPTPAVLRMSLYKEEQVVMKGPSTCSDIFDRFFKTENREPQKKRRRVRKTA